MKNINLATITMCSTDDRDRNMAEAEKLVRRAADGGADWVMLPEIFSFHGSYSRYYDNADPVNGPLTQQLGALAKELNICLFAGTIGERPEPHLPKDLLYNAKQQRRVYNTLLVFDRKGQVAGRYRKVHLFNLKDPGGKPLYCEGDGFIPGDDPVVIMLEGYRVGLSICYDLRFPEYYSRLSARQPLDVIALPSAFTRATGEAHWELLLRARAVEQQCYVFSSNQCGVHGPGKESWGHSMIVDPWGKVLADTGDKPGVAGAVMEPATIAAVRGRLPALQNRRPEIYGP